MYVRVRCLLHWTRTLSTCTVHTHTPIHPFLRLTVSRPFPDRFPTVSRPFPDRLPFPQGLLECKSIQSSWRGECFEFGADELFPVLVYVVLRTNPAQLHSNLQVSCHQAVVGELSPGGGRWVVTRWW